MWKRKKKQKEAEAVEETVDAVTEKSASSEAEQAVSVETEKISSAKEEKIRTTAEEVPPADKEKMVSAAVEKTSLEEKEEKAGNTIVAEEVSSSGVFITCKFRLTLSFFYIKLTAKSRLIFGSQIDNIG